MIVVMMTEEKFDIKKAFSRVAKEAELVGVERFINAFLQMERRHIDKGEIDVEDIRHLHDILDEAGIEAKKKIREEYE